MASTAQAPPLNYEASAGTTNLQSTSQLPEEVAQCLGNARFASPLSLLPLFSLLPMPPAHPSIFLSFFLYIQTSLYLPQPLHLATCTNLHPHVSLMNYTYLPAGSSPYTRAPTIVMTTNPASKKSVNLVENPHVSLLVHDWVSHRPRRMSSSGNGNGNGISPHRRREGGGGGQRGSSLAELLVGLNASELSSISVTIYGEARLVEGGTEEEGFL
ncbi:Pyridoxamine 5'-phosphate oxidase-like protein [Lachnellula cervina]|uniref:Pyridoxamine 5'-phosphate oxidase-like protein n=1 Tax=Lachnellula cervina TaxID=1316786 RepID=A0A7D8YJL8_9HELO|nr:Pyridoxamine 5'-phosphate oxidase-like protein [Lachnellula cervina]